MLWSYATVQFRNDEIQDLSSCALFGPDLVDHFHQHAPL